MKKRVFSVLLILVLLMSSCILASADSEDCLFTLSFNFDEHSSEDVAMVDLALSSMLLSNVKIEDENGYSRVTTVTKDGISTTTYSYGFTSLVLQCEKSGDTLYTWHISTDAYPKSELGNKKDFAAIWEKNHPDCRRITQITIEFDDLYGFVVLYHEK